MNLRESIVEQLVNFYKVNVFILIDIQLVERFSVNGSKGVVKFQPNVNFTT